MALRCFAATIIIGLSSGYWYTLKRKFENRSIANIMTMNETKVTSRLIKSVDNFMYKMVNKSTTGPVLRKIEKKKKSTHFN
jgi:hypothetical protein